MVLMLFVHGSRHGGDLWIFNISKESKISTTRYLALRENYLKRTSELEEVIEKESLVINESIKLKDEIIILKNKKNELQQSLLKWQNTNDINLISGEWELHYSSLLNDEKQVEKLNINSNNIDFYTSKSSGTIINFFKSPDSKHLNFVVLNRLKNTENREEIKLYSLTILDDFKLLQGTSKSQFRDEEVTFKKIS